MKINLIYKLTTYHHRVFILLVLGLALLLSISFGGVANAAPVTGFNPGNIIDDPTFTNSTSMTPHQIQTFLSSKVPTCDTNGAQQSEMNNAGVPDYNGNGSIQRWEWGKAKYNQTTFPCLKDYKVDNVPAAQIIYDAAQEFSINPQVLIVLLQKEQALITDTWPLNIQYRSATGYGCPDTAACDSQYYGLKNQIRWAATMFRAILNDSPTWYTPYVLGNNYIQWSPNSACGGSTVNIQNRSTQALYNYTPYQPNQSALNAGYGLGDGCGAYGNRNFFLYFRDWFGPTTINGTFLRTLQNGTLYLIVGQVKYPIADINIYNALYPLGGVGYVSQSYLDTKTTGSLLGRVVRSSAGTVYFFDAGIKLAFSSCTQVEAYGSSCGQSILLEDYQINKLSTGPLMTSVLKTTSGKTFYMNGTKREVYDDQALTNIGVSNSANVLNESALNNLSYGAPVIRNNTIIKERGVKTKYINITDQITKIKDELVNDTHLGRVPSKELDKESIAFISKTADLGMYLSASNGDTFVLTSDGKIRVINASHWTNQTSIVPDEILNQIPTTRSQAAPYFAKTSTSSTVYLVKDRQKLAISSWSDVLTVTKDPQILVVSNAYLATLTDGPAFLGFGRFYKPSSHNSVYMIDGYGTKIPMGNLNVANEYPGHEISTVSSAALNAYDTGDTMLSSFVQCGSYKGMFINQSIYPIDLSYATYRTLSSENCNNYTQKDTVPFLREDTGTIYKIEDSKKRPIGGYGTYVSLGGNSQNTIEVSDYTLGLIQTGTRL